MRGGFLNILKPPGMTSHDVVAYLKKVLKTKKIGHSGTLDPSAAGVLLVAVDQATRLLEYLPSDKGYIADITLGVATDTLDAEGEIIKKEPQKTLPSKELIAETLSALTGELEQRPPLYSAVKIRGEKLYQLARKGIEIDIPPRKIQIYALKLISFVPGQFPCLRLRVSCSSGTYIRALAEDLGKKLNLPAHLSFLVRDRIGTNLIEHSTTLEELEAAVDQKMPLPWLSLEGLVNLPKVCLSDQEAQSIAHGKPIASSGWNEGESLLLFDDGAFLAIGCYSSGQIFPKKVFTVS